MVEEACILGIPTIQMRYSTERPEVYEVGSSIKFDPTTEVLELDEVHSKANELNKTKSSSSPVSNLNTHTFFICFLL